MEDLVRVLFAIAIISPQVIAKVRFQKFLRR